MNIEEIPIAELDLDPANVRQHDEKNLAAIKSSLKRFGQQKPIVVDPKGIVIAGNGTLTAARALGWDRIRIVRTQLEGSEATAYAIADNRTAELATWDDDALMQQLSALDLEDSALVEAAGFSAAELEGMVDGLLGEKDLNEDEVPELPEDPITQPGDLWILGDHRLLCGDSTKIEDVERLMAGESADLCFTSPPYALGKSIKLSGNKSMSSKDSAYDEHEDDADDWLNLMRSWFKISEGCVSSVWVINVQPLAGNKRDLITFMHENADNFVDVATWDKGHAAPAMAAGVLSSRFEWLLIYSPKNKASRAVPLSSWRGTMQSVYEGAPQRNNEAASIHGATMPLHLPLWVIGELCDKTKTIYEPFSGTGTTIIAAEQLGRRCFGMEISPQYCDVIVERWENLTGRKAELERRADDDQEKIQSQA
jgi:DNA modification methylase